jgi:hypothetical protein
MFLVRVSNDTRMKLTALKQALEVREGRELNLDDAVQELLVFYYEKKHENSGTRF